MAGFAGAARRVVPDRQSLTTGIISMTGGTDTCYQRIGVVAAAVYVTGISTDIGIGAVAFRASQLRPVHIGDMPRMKTAADLDRISGQSAVAGITGKLSDRIPIRGLAGIGRIMTVDGTGAGGPGYNVDCELDGKNQYHESNIFFVYPHHFSLHTGTFANF